MQQLESKLACQRLQTVQSDSTKIICNIQVILSRACVAANHKVVLQKSATLIVVYTLSECMCVYTLLLIQ